jgi:amidohydrolase family protein
LLPGEPEKTENMTERYAGAARPALPPAEPLPALSCDCHLHVFGDPAKFPDRNPNPVHPSRAASWEDALRMHGTVGFGRGVLVQPANYTTDHSYLREALQGVPRGRYRATGIIDETVTDAELERLHAAGMRGVRFNFVRMFKMAPSAKLLRHSIDRIRQYGWYIKIFIGPEELPDTIETLRAITAVPVVIDHMARLKPDNGTWCSTCCGGRISGSCCPTARACRRRPADGMTWSRSERSFMPPHPTAACSVPTGPTPTATTKAAGRRKAS